MSAGLPLSEEPTVPRYDDGAARPSDPAATVPPSPERTQYERMLDAIYPLSQDDLAALGEEEPTERLTEDAQSTLPDLWADAPDLGPMPAPTLTAHVSLVDDREPVEELAFVAEGEDDGSGPIYTNLPTAEQVARIEALIEAALAELRGGNDRAETMGKIARSVGKDVRAIRQEQLGAVTTPGAPIPFTSNRWGGLFRKGQETCYGWLEHLVGPALALLIVSVIGGAVAGAVDAAIGALPDLFTYGLSLLAGS